MKNTIVKIMALSLMLTVLSLSVAYAAGNPKSINKSNDEQQLKDKLTGIDGKRAVAIANKWRMDKIDVVTFVTPEKVTFKFKDGQMISVPLPDDVMMVSIAPYIDKTHECITHYMSSCDAEMKNINVKILAVTAAGKTLINKTMKTAPTGFLDLWLPRNQVIHITVSAKGKSATGKIFTNRDSKTCETTLKLE
ncbi:MAG: CueP family metal-binding protein [Smithella sp.]|nr:CueP family metal-binding protein [Smithella sp.]